MRISGLPAAGRRRAFTMVEVAITSMILMIAMSLTVQVLGWVAAERLSVDRRQCAITELSNIMERLSARPWEELTSGESQPVPLSAYATRKLPGAELTLTIDQSAAAGSAKRLTLMLHWRNRRGDREKPVRLTAWIERDGGQR